MSTRGMNLLLERACNRALYSFTLKNNYMTIGTQVVFLNDTDERFGTIEYISNDRVHICGLDGSLYITNVQSILYPLCF